MSRSKSIETLNTGHISFEDDSVGCIFHKTKANQDGSGSKVQRHIYANPFSPSTCWITALSVYWACNADQLSGSLFPGSNQKNRFGKVVARLLKSDGGQNRQYGTHSIRKGVATFSCSGSTGGPSIVSVCLRCGWSLGGVQDRYLRYEAAGDQYLGRIVAGLPLNKADFAVLPPNFVQSDDELVAKCIHHRFPKLKNESHLTGVLQLCLASLIYNAKYLVGTLPVTHPLLSTYVFRQIGVRNELASKITLEESSIPRASGIPPRIELYKQQQTLHNAMIELPNVVIAGVGDLMYERGVNTGNITHELLQRKIKDLIKDLRSKY